MAELSSNEESHVLPSKRKRTAEDADDGKHRPESYADDIDDTSATVEEKIINQNSSGGVEIDRKGKGIKKEDMGKDIMKVDMGKGLIEDIEKDDSSDDEGATETDRDDGFKIRSAPISRR